VVNDQVFSPTCAPDLAAAVLALVKAEGRGLFHVSGSGACTWHEMAVATLDAAGLSVPVEAIRSAELGAAAPRPAYSVLDNGRYRSLGLPPLRPWHEALLELVRSLSSRGQAP